MSPHEPDRQPLTDQHTIETPEQMSLRLPLAGIGSRFLAVAVDSLMQLGLAIAMLLAVSIFGPVGGGQASVWVIAAFSIAIFLILYGYYAIFEILWNGQTPGKRVVGIRVVKDSGRPLTPVETIGRNLLRIVDQIPVVYLVGVAVAMLNAQHKRLGDFVAGSIVIREAALAELKPVWQSSVSPPANPVGAGNLSLEDLALIDTFLSRRYSLEANVRANIAQQILSRLLPKLGQEPSGASAEEILEALAYQRRSAGH